MKTVASITLAAVVFAVAATATKPAVSKDIIDHVNRKYAAGETTWQAGYNLKFVDATVDQVKSLMGTKLDSPDYKNAMNRLGKSPASILTDLPTNFDPRKKWPSCANVIGHIRDQAGCGSCWAFGSTEALNDRICIKTDGNFTTLLSPQDTASCCNLMNGCFGSNGCNGGIPAEAWNYFKTHGVVTGGDYDDNGKSDTCFPYELPNCNHHVNGPYPPCKEGGSTPACPSPRQCSNTNYLVSWDNDKHHAATTYGFNSIEHIMSDLYTYGSVTAAFTVYEDFVTYKSGVYRHETGSALGGHAIKVIGWGVESGTPYWLVANSWNSYWGDDGYFKILRGSDECGIESNMVAGLA